MTTRSGGGRSGSADRGRGPAVGAGISSRCGQTDRAHQPLRIPGTCAGWLRSVRPAAWSVSAQRARSATSSPTPRCSSTPRRCRTCATRSTGSGFTGGPAGGGTPAGPAPAGGEEGTPRYLLDTYPATLAHDPQRLAQLVGDIGWVEAAIASAGVDRVLADLRRAAAANPASTAVAAVLAAVTGQAYDLRPPQPVDQPGYILRQLWMQAAELAEDDLAEDIRSRLQSRPGPGLVPRWTTRRASRALSGELGRHDGRVAAVAVLADGRVVTGGADGRVLVWDPAAPGDRPGRAGPAVAPG